MISTHNCYSAWDEERVSVQRRLFAALSAVLLTIFRDLEANALLLVSLVYIYPAISPTEFTFIFIEQKQNIVYFFPIFLFEHNKDFQK